MGLFDGAFAQQPGWLSALFQNPNLLNPGGIAQSGGFPQSAGMAAPLPPPQTIPQAPQPDAMAQGRMPPAMGAPSMPQPEQAQNPFSRGMSAIGNFLTEVGTMGAASKANANQELVMKALVARGMDPDTARAAAATPALLSAIAPVLFGTKSQTDDIKEFEYAKTQGFKGTLEDWMQRKRGGAGEYGMTPIWGIGPDGKPAVLQLGKSGSAVASKMPDGFSIARDPIKVEGPTGTVILDPQTRQQIGFIPKDVKGAAKEKEVGEAEGQALVNLPTVIATAETTLKTIEQLKNHPGKKSWGALGIGGMLPDMPGTDTRGFGALVDQVKGQNFMTAFQALKGAGAITEQEGAKAERAQARLDRGQNKTDFDQAITDLEEIVRAGMERARAKAGVKAAAPKKRSITELVEQYGK